MKRWLMLLAFPLSSLAAGLPDGFDGLRWEAPVAQLQQAQKLAETPYYQCFRSGDGNGSVGGTAVANKRLCFSKDRFYFAQMEFVGQAAYDALLAHAKAQWGEGRSGQRFSETHVWGGGEEAVYIELEFSRIDDRGTLALVYLPVYRETQEASRQERARSRPGAGY